MKSGKVRRCETEPVSFYVPARNAEPTLAACIEAVRAQTRPPDEFFILVDPRSDDRTAPIARASGVRVVEQTGSTLGAARNQAVMAAAHRWVACCDADVLIRPDWLEILAARRGSGAAGIGGRTIERTRGPADEWRALHMPHHWGEHAFRNPFMLVSEVLFDRTALLAAGGYRDDLNYYEDSDLCQRLRECGYDLLYEPAAVGVHQRSDDLIGLLTLRWKYSEYRQRHLLDRFVGLLEKCRVNREHALNTLARSLARGREELAYVSYLLFFHHLLMDLRSLLSRRPMLPEKRKLLLERQLADWAMTAAARTHAGSVNWVREDLAAMFPPEQAGTNADGLPPNWPGHLAAVRATVERFCAEVPAEVMGIIEASASYCHRRRPAARVPRFERPSAERLQSTLESLPLRPCVDASLLGTIQATWPESDGVRLIGTAMESEREVVNTLCGDATGKRGIVAVAAHLESRSEPCTIFQEVDAGVHRLVACYQPPERFVPGLEAATPADLASAAAAAGWTIERFDTLVGRTRLMLSR